MRSKVTIIVLLLVLAGIIALFFWIRNRGFSARAEPSWAEKMMARHARRIATPAGAKELKNPYPMTAASMAEAREHWGEHCAICHGLDGRGETTIGRNLYPKAPDMLDANTQQLSDGELFYIISNGVRFTGMPAWGNEDSAESIWALVAFIRHLPQLSPEELKEMQKAATQEQAEMSGDESKEEAAKPRGHTHSPGTKPHKH